MSSSFEKILHLDDNIMLLYFSLVHENDFIDLLLIFVAFSSVGESFCSLFLSGINLNNLSTIYMWLI